MNFIKGMPIFSLLYKWQKWDLEFKAGAQSCTHTYAGAHNHHHILLRGAEYFLEEGMLGWDPRGQQNWLGKTEVKEDVPGGRGSVKKGREGRERTCCLNPETEHSIK